MTERQSTPCLICGQPLAIRLAHGRKSGKPSVFLVCPADGRHFRAFIYDREFVEGFLARLEDHTPKEQAGSDLEDVKEASRRSKTNLERAD